MQDFYCWFAGNFMAAMLVVEDKSISLLWQLKSIFMKILGKEFYCITTNLATLSRG